MAEPNYAVVAYLSGSVGEFVDALRRLLNPAYAAWLAHVTILPPRPLRGIPEAALTMIRHKCAALEPFEVSVSRVATFWPVTGVVYLSLTQGFERLVQLHDELNCEELAHAESYPYVPHLTIAQELDQAATQTALVEVSREWLRFVGDPCFQVESVCLVRQTLGNLWVDVAPVPLGGLLVPTQK